MPGRYRLRLSQSQKAELEIAKQKHPKAYIREQANAILKVEQGLSLRRVALHNLNKARDPETVKSWVDRYLENGISGLLVKPGRGRKTVTLLGD